jgi:hypothetical protein
MILLLVEMMNQSLGTCPKFGVHFNTRFIFSGLKYGDVLEVRVDDKSIIASLRFEGKQIYTVEEYEKNREGLVDAMYRTMRNISIVFIVIMLFLVRNPKINNNLFSD